MGLRTLSLGRLSSNFEDCVVGNGNGNENC